MQYKRRHHPTSGSTKWSIRRKSAGDGGFLDCPYCENVLHYINGEIDHIDPWEKSFNNRKNNMVLVCKECNTKKNRKSLLQWLIEEKIAPESVYNRLKKLKKKIPQDMLDYLGYE